MISTTRRLIELGGRAAAVAVLTLTAQMVHAGAITFVQASVTNTVGAASGLVDWNSGDDTVPVDGGTTADGLWRYRGGQEMGIWEATTSSSVTEDAVEIRTSATGLSDGLYEAYVFYYAITNSGDFPIRAGFAANPNMNAVFDRAGNKGTAGGDALADLDFVMDPPPGSGNRTLLYGLIGQTTVSGGTLSVYIDDWPASATGTSNDRTWYAGIGYAAVPEPASGALVVLGTVVAVCGARLSRWKRESQGSRKIPVA
jgi:hypothetical protein